MRLYKIKLNSLNKTHFPSTIICSLFLISMLFCYKYVLAKETSELKYSDEVVYTELSENTIKNMPVSVKIYYFIEKYSKQYGVPKRIVYGVIREETGFRSPLDFNYNPKQTSYASAMGPMQLMYPTAKFMSDDKSITREQVLTDVELNVKLGIKYLDYLYKIYHDWEVVLGFYNSGKPIVNDYAKRICSEYNKKL